MWMSYQNTMFKYSKLRIVTQALSIKQTYQTHFIFNHNFQYLNT